MRARCFVLLLTIRGTHSAPVPASEFNESHVPSSTTSASSTFSSPTDAVRARRGLRTSGHQATATEYLGFASQGYCRTGDSDDNKGEYTSHDVTPEACKSMCDANAYCTAYEVGGNTICEIHTTERITHVKESANGSCFRKMQYLGFASQGFCRTADDGTGDHTTYDLSGSECMAKCEEDPSCVAYEIGTNGCEIHTTTITHVKESSTGSCFRRIAPPSYLGFASQGWCRTADDGNGDFKRYDLTSDECKRKCNADSACVAYEVRPTNDYKCEIHTTPITHVEESEDGSCFRKNAPLTYRGFPAQGACRTADDGFGTHVDHENLTPQECKDKCDEEPTCVAYETNEDNNKCEIHTTPITHTAAFGHISCHRKLSATVYAGWHVQGWCRTADDGIGSFTRHDLTSDECKSECDAQSACVAYEVRPTNDFKCEIHTDTITHVDPSNSGSCFRKVTVASPDKQLLRETPLLGTHDAATGFMGRTSPRCGSGVPIPSRLAKTQEVNLVAQLNCGARMLDLRLTDCTTWQDSLPNLPIPIFGGSLGLGSLMGGNSGSETYRFAHGPVVFSQGPVGQVPTLVSWAKAHPDEIVLLYFQKCEGFDCTVLLSVLDQNGVFVLNRDESAGAVGDLTVAELKSYAGYASSWTHNMVAVFTDAVDDTYNHGGAETLVGSTSLSEWSDYRDNTMEAKETGDSSKLWQLQAFFQQGNNFLDDDLMVPADGGMNEKLFNDLRAGLYHGRSNLFTINWIKTGIAAASEFAVLPGSVTTITKPDLAQCATSGGSSTTNAFDAIGNQMLTGIMAGAQDIANAGVAVGSAAQGAASSVADAAEDAADAVEDFFSGLGR